MSHEIVATDPAFASLEAVEALVRSFEDCSIDRGEWSHACHVATAAWYVAHHGEEEGARRMRDALLHYAAVHGIVPSGMRGYHETITLAWMRLVGRYVAAMGRDVALLDLVNGCVANFPDKNVVMSHYSSERLWSDAARAAWVEPDLRPF